MKTIKLIILLALISFTKTETKAQGDADVYNEAYARAHVAYSGFSKLGVTSTTYAKCVKAVNYHEPGKVPGIVNINGEEFRDDGKNFDQRAGDGILTSVKASNYEKGSPVTGIGSYQMATGNNILCDENFNHVIPGQEILGFKIKCKFVWVSCYSWPIQIRSLCLQTSWPFDGYFSATECEIEISF